MLVSMEPVLEMKKKKISPQLENFQNYLILDPHLFEDTLI